MKIKKEFLIWLAGFIDGDGSIHIGVREQNQNGYPYVAIRPVVNITQHIKYKWVCDYIYQTMKMGKVYVANRNNANAKATWQTLKAKEIIYLLTALKPYLIVKKRQAETAIPVLKEWVKSFITIAKDGQRIKGVVRKQDVVLNMVKVATTLNSDMKTSAKSRGYKTYRDWKPLIEKWYPK